MAEAVESQSRLAYLKLESLIVTLQLAPGALVTEKTLLSLAGYGRTPVREAIQKLEWQGLVSVRPRAGLRIAGLDPAHPAMIYQVRRQLEPLAARLMAANIDPEARESLIACAKAMTECSVTGDRIGFLGTDKMFDEILERTCPNPFITQALSPLQTHGRRYWFQSAGLQSLEEAVDRHVKVIRALLQGDADASASAMIEMIDALARQSAGPV